MTKFKERIHEYETIEQAYRELSRQFIEDPEMPDGSRGTFNLRMFSHDHTVLISKPSGGLNLAENSFMMSRWDKKFLPEYFELESFRYFLQFLKKRRTRAAQEYGYVCPAKARHSLGNCLLSVTVRTGKQNPRVALYSRSCYFQPTGCLDASFAGVFCDYVSEVIGTPVDLVWHISHLQQNCWKAIPWVLNNDLEPESFTPGSAIQEKWLKNMRDAIEWAKEDFDPNPRYMFYARMIKKMHAIFERKEAGLPLQIIIPTLPNYYLTEEEVDIKALSYDEEEEDEE